ncbi:MAG: hypothetical protein PHF64_07750, partial [Methanoregula sp.]|nr:hypothetical protein [Methanoregula sp.]
KQDKHDEHGFCHQPPLFFKSQIHTTSWELMPFRQLDQDKTSATSGCHETITYNSRHPHTIPQLRFLIITGFGNYADF